jgi:hypothetical protein
MPLKHLLLLSLLLAVSGGMMGGCNNRIDHSLFSNGDALTRDRIDKYYGRDSAVEARASRSKASEMGFGFPTGMANQ